MLLLGGNPVRPSATLAVDEQAVSTTTNSKTKSTTSNRPTAPLEALLPATEKRLLLRKCLELAKELVDKQSKEAATCGGDGVPCSPEYGAIVTELKSILEPPGDSVSKKAAISGTQRYWVDSSVTEKANLNKLSGVSVRAAMNVYTAKLRFGETYVLTASPEEKKSYIRKYSRLPDVKQVISADLDLRDLYRNLVQTKVDDAQAELYRKKLDALELQTVLQEANDALQQWFSLISEDDVAAAEKAAKQKQ